MRPDQAVALFARPPILGTVKTRLRPALTPEESLRLYEAMLADAVETLREATRDLALPLVYWASPFAPAGELAAVIGGIPQRVQSGDDLGERMARAFQEILQSGARRVLLIGTDAPTLPPSRIADGLARLSDHDVVIGPAEDGGYYLLGARRLVPALFRKIPWGTDRVLPTTRRRLREEGTSHVELAAWYDVDTPADLGRLWRELTHMKEKSIPGLPLRTWRAMAPLAAGRF